MAVIDAAGRAVPSATVECKPLPALDPLLARSGFARDASEAAGSVRVGATDASGTSLFRLPAGPWAVTARAPGYGAAAASVSLVEGAAEHPARLVLFPGAALEGLVLRAPGVPFPDAVVAARPAAGDGAHATTAATSDADGRYRLSGLAPGHAWLTVVLPSGFRVAAGVVDLPGTTRMDLLVPAGLDVRGRVVDDATGTAVASARVSLSLVDMGTGRGSSGCTETGTDGAFAFPGLPPQRVGGLQVEADGYLPWAGGRAGDGVSVGVRAPGEPLVREIRLVRGATVRGRVLDPSGAPVATARVSFAGRMAVQGMTIRRASPVAVSGADGRYEARCVLPGPCLARVEAAGFARPAADEERGGVDVPASGTLELDLHLVAAAVVTGRVTAPDGSAVAGALVGPRDAASAPWTGDPAVSDAEGAFRVEGVPPGRWRFLARHGSGLRGTSASVEVGSGATVVGVAIALRPGATLAGTVLDPDGAPVPGARVLLHAGSAAFPGQSGDALQRLWHRGTATPHPVAADGTFRIEELDAGTWTVHAMAPGRAPAWTTVDGAREGSAQDHLRLVLAPGRVAEGRVLDPDGAPVPGAAVAILPAGGTLFHSGTLPGAAGTTDAAGRFRVDDLEPGAVSIRVARAGYAPAEATLSAEETSVEVRLSLPLALAGRITAEDGRPAASVAVTAHDESRLPGPGSYVETATDVSGRYRIDGLSAGPWTVVAGSTGGPWVAAKREAVPGGTDGVDFVLRGGAVIAGSVRDPRGRPVAGAQVRVTGEDAAGGGIGRNGMAESAADGSFSVGGLLPGIYAVTAWSTGGGEGLPPSVTGIAAGTRDLVLSFGTPSPPPADEPPTGDATIAGTVTLRGGGIPPEGTPVLAIPERRPPPGAPLRVFAARTDARGAFLVTDLAPGAYRLVAARGSRDLAAGWLDGPTEAGATGVALEVSPGRRLSGRLAGEGAGTLRWIRAVPPGAPDDACEWRAVGAGGSFALEPLPEGSVRLEGRRAGEAGTVDLGPSTVPGEDVIVDAPRE